MTPAVTSHVFHDEFTCFILQIQMSLDTGAFRPITKETTATNMHVGNAQ